MNQHDGSDSRLLHIRLVRLQYTCPGAKRKRTSGRAAAAQGRCMDGSEGNSMARMPTAIQDFREARQRAGLNALLARLRGRSVSLLNYDEVVRHLRPTSSAERGL